MERIITTETKYTPWVGLTLQQKRNIMTLNNLGGKGHRDFTYFSNDLLERLLTTPPHRGPIYQYFLQEHTYHEADFEDTKTFLKCLDEYIAKIDAGEGKFWYH